MDRVIASHLKPLFMREILFGSLKEGGQVQVVLRDGQSLGLQPLDIKSETQA